MDFSHSTKWWIFPVRKMLVRSPEGTKHHCHYCLWYQTPLAGSDGNPKIYRHGVRKKISLSLIGQMPVCEIHQFKLLPIYVGVSGNGGYLQFCPFKISDFRKKPSSSWGNPHGFMANFPSGAPLTASRVITSQVRGDGGAITPSQTWPEMAWWWQVKHSSLLCRYCVHWVRKLNVY